MFDVGASTIFVTLAGSQAHGTARSDSDVDLRGVCVAPLAIRLSLFRSFEQSDEPLTGELWTRVLLRLEAHPTAARGLGVRTEIVVFELAKFMSLCAAGNPNSLEILFADERDWLYETPAWRTLHAARHQFLTAKVQQNYLGYALAQLKRIRTHRSWLLEPPRKKPTRPDFGLPEGGALGRDDQNRLEQSLAEKLRSYGVDDIDMSKASRIAVEERLTRFWQDAAVCSEAQLASRMRAIASQALSLPEEVVSTLNAEKRYLAAMKQWESYQTWKTERNPTRAELEQQHGYDTKHAMHLVRLMRMGLEVLQTGELNVRRDDAQELLEIRDGRLSYDQLSDLAEDLQSQMKNAQRHHSLTTDINQNRVDELFEQLIRA